MYKNKTDKMISLLVLLFFIILFIDIVIVIKIHKDSDKLNIQQPHSALSYAKIISDMKSDIKVIEQTQNTLMLQVLTMQRTFKKLQSDKRPEIHIHSTVKGGTEVYNVDGEIAIQATETIRKKMINKKRR